MPNVRDAILLGGFVVVVVVITTKPNRNNLREKGCILAHGWFSPICLGSVMAMGAASEVARS